MKLKNPLRSVALLPLLTTLAWGQDVTSPNPVAEEAAGPQRPTPIWVAENDGTSEFGEPLVVNGKRIPDLAIKRFLCYGKGRGGLEARKMEVLMQQERELRSHLKQLEVLDEQFDGRALSELSEAEQALVQEAVDRYMARFDSNPEELAAKIEAERESFYERYPTLDLDTEIRRAYQSTDWYIDQIRQTMAFDDLFFPGHPDNWPEITIEAIHAGSPAFDLVEDYAKNYELRREIWDNERLETEADLLLSQFEGRSRDQLDEDERAELERQVDDAHGEFPPREDEMMMTLLRDFIIAQLTDPNLVRISTSTDGLPLEQLMVIEGGGFRAELLTEDVYEDMKDAFDQHDIDEAKHYLALYQAALDRLEAEGELRSYADFLVLIEDVRAQLQGSMFGYDFLALQGHMFPSMEVYNEHAYLQDSFRKSIEHLMQLDENQNLPPAIQDYMPIANGIMGLAKVQSEVLLVSAFDWPNNEWKENGWEEAKERAYELRAQIDAHLDVLVKEDEARREAITRGENFQGEAQPFDEFWAELLDYNSEYWDPPLPVSGKMPAMVGMKNKGRFTGQPMTRNDLKRAIGESSWSHFMDNEEIVDHIFFDLEEGEVGGPYKGPHGYYIVYVKRKLRPTNPVSYREERQWGMIQEDYTRRRFTEYCHKALQDAEVKGL